MKENEEKTGAFVYHDLLSSLCIHITVVFYLQCKREKKLYQNRFTDNAYWVFHQILDTFAEL